MITRKPAGRRTAVGMALLVALLAAGLAAQQPAGERRIMVTVVDQNKAPVMGLTAKDFAIREDGVMREIVGAERASEPPYIVLTTDTSRGSGADRDVRDLRNALTTFVKTVHAANPEAMIALMDHGGAAVKLVDFTKDTAELEKTIGRLFFKQDPSVALEALDEAGRELAKRQTTRKIIVLYQLDAAAEHSQLRGPDLARRIQQVETQVWAITLRDRDDSNPNRDNMLNGITLMTGGARLTVLTSSALEGAFKQLADLLMGQYAVTFLRPASAKPPEKLEVGMYKENVIVAARKWAPK
jgi:VWFA-related protein